ncbi:MAG: energy-coupling factor transporter transmembrane protein EcfT [Cellulosilyticaceae bacterium]
MNKSGSLYIDKPSFLHEIDGGIKLIWVILWSVFTFMFMDLRIFLALIVFGGILLKASKIEFKAMKPLLIFVLVFTIFNSLLLLIITPSYGSKLAGTTTILLQIGVYKLTAENLFYVLTISCKYIALLPITLLFLLTTHPSKFASSLNRIGVPYKVAYTVNIALRYIPDVKAEIKNIIMAQEARGAAFKKGDAPVHVILKNYMTVLIPLVLGSLDRIEVVSNAMDLRGFGKDKTRTWYVRENLKHIDMIAFVVGIALIILGFVLKANLNHYFWYPFV